MSSQEELYKMQQQQLRVSLARMIQRQHRWENKPTTLKDVAIPSELQLTLREETFLANESGSDHGERFMIHTTELILHLFQPLRIIGFNSSRRYIYGHRKVF